MIYGHDEAIGQFRSAWDKRTLHHAWLLAGPKGVGKATFAYQAARRLLAEAAGPNLDLPGLQVPDDHPVAKLITAGSHPDMRSVKRLENDKGNLNRNIKVDQIRELREFMALSPAMDAAWPWLLDLFGGRQSARSIHFIVAWGLLVFLVVHVVLVLLSGPIRQLRDMILGGRIDEAA